MFYDWYSVFRNACETQRDERLAGWGNKSIRERENEMIHHNFIIKDSIIKPETPAKYKSDDDIVSLEDESGRVEISGTCLSKEFLVTGMVVGILGKEIASGAFEAIDICLPGLADQDPFPETKDDPKYVALLSGLNIGEENGLDMRFELLSEFLTGELGSSLDQKSSSTISRVILAGNSVAKPNKMVDLKKPVSFFFFCLF